MHCDMTPPYRCKRLNKCFHRSSQQFCFPPGIVSNDDELRLNTAPGVVLRGLDEVEQESHGGTDGQHSMVALPQSLERGLPRYEPQEMKNGRIVSNVGMHQ